MGRPFLCRRILRLMTTLPGKRMRGRKRTVVIILRLKIPKIRISLPERASHQKMLPRIVERPLMEKAKKRRIKKPGIKNLKIGEAKTRELKIKNPKTEEPITREPIIQIPKIRELTIKERALLPERNKRKKERRKESLRSRRKEKSGKPRKSEMRFPRNGRTSVKGQSRKSNIPLKKNKKNRGVWPGFCVWNRRNIRIFEIFSGGCPWIGKRWK